MKSSRVILAAVALVLLFGASTLWAQDDYCLPLEKQINPGVTVVKYDRIVYSLLAESMLSIKFEKIDAVHVVLHAKPLTEVLPMMTDVIVQWGGFQGISLTLGSSGDNAFILNTETGYAEK